MLDGDYLDLLISNEKPKYINIFNYVFNYAFSVIIVELESTNPIYIYVLPIQKIYFLTFNRLLIVNFSKEKTLKIIARFSLLSFLAHYIDKLGILLNTKIVYYVIQYLLHNEAKTHCPNGKKSHHVQATSLNINMDIGEYSTTD